MANRREFNRIADPQMRVRFHQYNLVHHEMSHFVRNVFSYILVEVLESAWKEFLDGMRLAGDLDALILL